MKKLLFFIFLMVFSFAITANAKKPKVVWPKAVLTLKDGTVLNGYLQNDIHFMKKYIYFLIAVSACLFVGCSDDDDNTVTIDSGVVGEWQLIEWNGNKAEDFDVYLELLSDGSFNLYQRVEYSYYEHFAGTFSVGENLLQGRYSDGKPWAGEYDYALSDGGYTLTLTDRKSNEVNIYTRMQQIPEDVRKTSVTRSMPGSRRFL